MATMDVDLARLRETAATLVDFDDVFTPDLVRALLREVEAGRRYREALDEARHVLSATLHHPWPFGMADRVRLAIAIVTTAASAYDRAREGE